MIVNLNDVLKPAQKDGYAVGLFNTVNFEMARGVIAAAEQTKSPVIIGTAEVLLPYAPLDELSYLLIPMAKKAKVPVVVHYDHGLTFEKCMEALKLGFSSIMYDCSTDTYDENVRKVAELVKIAHCFGTSVEAELGHVGNAEDSLEGNGDAGKPEDFYTEPEQAKEYVQLTNCDALAIAVGTVHGPYKAQPKLDYNRISAIARITDVPLVLHGGSGLSDVAFETAIERGISKVNIFTDVNSALASGAEAALISGKTFGTDLILDEIKYVKKATITKMEIFGCKGKA